MFVARYDRSDVREAKLTIDWEEHHKNPEILLLLRGWKQSLYTYSYVRHCNLTEFPDTKNRSLTVLYKTLASKTGDIIFVKSLDKFHLYVEKETGKLTITKNKRLVYTSRGLREALNIIIIAGNTTKVIYDFLLEVFKVGLEAGGDTCDIESMLSQYRVSRNLNLADLPWDEVNLRKIYHYPTEDMVPARQRMNYYLRKGNTKKATEACFFGNSYPKSIRKLMIIYGPYRAPKSWYDNVSSIIPVLGVDSTRNLITKAMMYNSATLMNPNVFKMIHRGFNITDIDYHVHDMCNDILNMEAAPGIDTSEIPPTKNLKDYHDALVVLIEVIRKEGDPKTKIFVANSIHNPELEYVNSSYEFKCAEFASDLYLIGKMLHNCVHAYSSDAFTGSCSIVTMHEKGESRPLVCIELRGNHIVQAKLNYNKPVFTDPVVLAGITEWAEDRDLVLNCRDTFNGEGHFSYTPYPNIEGDPERVALLEEADKILRATRPVRQRGYGYNPLLPEGVTLDDLQEADFNDVRPARAQLVEADDIPF